MDKKFELPAFDTEAAGFSAQNISSAEDLLHMGYSFMKLMSYYTCAMMEIETKFNVLNEEFSLLWDRQPISSIKTRLKDPISIRNKLVKKGLPVNGSSAAGSGASVKRWLAANGLVYAALQPTYEKE